MPTEETSHAILNERVCGGGLADRDIGQSKEMAVRSVLERVTPSNKVCSGKSMRLADTFNRDTYLVAGDPQLCERSPRRCRRGRMRQSLSNASALKIIASVRRVRAHNQEEHDGGPTCYGSELGYL